MKNKRYHKDEDVIQLQKNYLEQNYDLSKLPPYIKENLFDFIHFRHELTKESDRGCALLAASHLDYLLEMALRKKMLGSENHLDTLFNFNGALGTFSGRIGIAYSIGVITEYEHNDLNIIRKIRNEFGHKPIILNFEHESIRMLSHNLKLSASNDKPVRTKFLSSVSLLSSSLEFSKIKNRKGKTKKEIEIDKIRAHIERFRNEILPKLDLDKLISMTKKDKKH